MKYLITILTTLAFIVVPMTATATETLNRIEVKECVAESYKIDRDLRNIKSREEKLRRANNAISNLDSDLKGLDWQYNLAEVSLNTCRAMNNYNDNYCRNEIHKLDRLAAQYNNKANLFNRAVAALDRKIVDYNRDNDRLNNRIDRHNRQCYGKRMDTKVINQACVDYQSTNFCKSIRQE